MSRGAAGAAAGLDGVPGKQSVCPSRRRAECRARPLARLCGSRRPTATRVAAALARTGLAGKEARLPRELSGGERQRVALARALVRDRPVLLLDEPFASLGPALRDDMLDLVAALQRERQMTVLFVTHQPEDADAIADHVIFLEEGHVAAAGTAADSSAPNSRRRSGATPAVLPEGAQ